MIKKFIFYFIGFIAINALLLGRVSVRGLIAALAFAMIATLADKYLFKRTEEKIKKEQHELDLALKKINRKNP